MNRRNFFRKAMALAGVVALAPQLCFRQRLINLAPIKTVEMSSYVEMGYSDEQFIAAMERLHEQYKRVTLQGHPLLSDPELSDPEQRRMVETFFWGKRMTDG